MREISVAQNFSALYQEAGRIDRAFDNVQRFSVNLERFRDPSRIGEIRRKIDEKTIPILTGHFTRLKEVATERKRIIFSDFKFRDNTVVFPDGKESSQNSARMLRALVKTPSLTPLTTEDLAKNLFKDDGVDQLNWTRSTLNYLRKQLTPYGIDIVRVRGLDGKVGFIADTNREIKEQPKKEGKENEWRVSYYLLSQRLAEYSQANPNKPIVLSQLAKEMGLSRQRVHQLYRILANEQAVPLLYKQWGDNNQENLRVQVQSVWDRGIHSVDRIAKELGVHPRILQIICHDLKTEEKRVRDELKQAIISSRRKGMGEKTIAQNMGISKGLVNHILTSEIKTDSSLRLRKPRKSKYEIETFEQEVEKLRNKGLTNQQIADHLSTYVGVIGNYTKKLIDEGRIQKRKSMLRRSDILARHERIKTLRSNGKSYKEIAEELGITNQAVANILSSLRKKGEVEKKLRIKDQLGDQIKELLERGFRVVDIARELGQPYMSIYNIRRELSVDGQPVRGKMSSEDSAKLRLQIRELRLQGKKNREIEVILNQPHDRIANLSHQLIQRGEVPPIRGSKKEAN